MPTRVIRSLNDFSAALATFGNATRGSQRLAVARSTDRMDRALDQAATRLAGGDRVLSGVGKRGAKLSHTTTRPIASADESLTVFRKEGPWQIRDSTRTGGPTKTRLSSPKLRRTPRPAPPATKFMPSLKDRNGNFYSNFETDPGGPFVEVNLGRGPRTPAWGNAVQSVQPSIMNVHKDAFDDAMNRAFG